MKILKFTFLFMFMFLCFSSLILNAQVDDLIHHYKFDGDLDDAVGDANGVLVTDIVGYIPATLTFMEGYDGTTDGAIDFVDAAGVNYMIYVGSWSAAQEGTSDELTIAFWAYWHGSTGSYQDIINKRTNYNQETMMWGINQHFSNDDMLSCVRSGSAAVSSQAIPVEEWTHVAIAMDGTNAYFYMNGEKYDEQPYMLGTGYDAMIHMGCAVNTDYAWRSQDVYNGALDDVRFYSRVLDEDEVLAIYEGEADISGINDKVAAQFELAQNYPNPFNSSTTIEYSLPGNSQTEIVVYDLLGHEVATLVDGYRNAGKYKVTWDASELSTGVYIYQLKTDDFIVSKKMKLIK